MATKKNFYYVLVFTNGGPVYVTSVNNSSRVARWNVEERPCEMGKQYAEELAWGLRLNGTHAVMVCNPYEIDTQPYNYEEYECTFVEKETTK